METTNLGLEALKKFNSDVKNELKLKVKDILLTKIMPEIDELAKQAAEDVYMSSIYNSEYPNESITLQIDNAKVVEKLKRKVDLLERRLLQAGL